MLMERRVGLLRMTIKLMAATQTKDSWFSVLFGISVFSSLLSGIASTSWTLNHFHLSLFMILVFHMGQVTSRRVRLLHDIHPTLYMSEVMEALWSLQLSPGSVLNLGSSNTRTTTIILCDSSPVSLANKTIFGLLGVKVTFKKTLDFVFIHLLLTREKSYISRCLISAAISVL